MCFLTKVYLQSQIDLNGDTESEIIAANDQALKQNITQQILVNRSCNINALNTEIY
jgi:hypothetical protein